jgi:hypothetical protein
VRRHLLWAGLRHGQVLLVQVAPAGEEAVGGEEEEEVLPAQAQMVGVEHLGSQVTLRTKLCSLDRDGRHNL